MDIRVDPDRCCSSGMCVLTAPDLFDQGEEDGTVRLLRPPRTEAEEAAARDAACLCPSLAITLTDG